MPVYRSTIEMNCIRVWFQAFISTAFIILNLTVALSQSVNISGYIKSKDGNTPLEGAKILVQDSEGALSGSGTMTIANSKGFFSISHSTTVDSIHLSVSYTFHTTYRQTISSLPSKIQLDTIILQTADNFLGVIEVKAKLEPIAFKQDTIRFNTDAFETMPEANVEDLLDILPGVNVDSEGGIMVNGKKIDRILVDGQPFFENDLTIATRNLPKDILTAIEVTDSKTDSEALAEDTGAQTHKTINLILKNGRKEGLFGEVSTGIGLQQRHSTGGMVNYFKNTRKLSLIGGINNINKPGFSQFQQTLSQHHNTGGIQNLGHVGFNFSDQLNSKMTVSGNYTLTRTNNTNQTESERKTFIPNHLFFSRNQYGDDTENNQHQFKANVDYQITPRLLLNISPHLSFHQKNGLSRVSNRLFDQHLTLINHQEQSSFNHQSDFRFGNQIALTQKTGHHGSVFKLTLSYLNQTLRQQNSIESNTDFLMDSLDNNYFHQNIEGLQNESQYHIYSNYKIPIHKSNTFLILSTQYQLRKIRQDQYSRTFLDNDQSVLPTDFNLKNYHSDFKPSLGFLIRKKKMEGRCDNRLCNANMDIFRPTSYN